MLHYSEQHKSSYNLQYRSGYNVKKKPSNLEIGLSKIPTMITNSLKSLIFSNKDSSRSIITKWILTDFTYNDRYKICSSIVTWVTFTQEVILKMLTSRVVLARLTQTLINVYFTLLTSKSCVTPTQPWKDLPT